MTTQTDTEVLARLESGDEFALKQLFDDHFQDLYKYGDRIVNDQGAAEEIVQDVFVNLWNKKDQLIISNSILAYLKKCLKNRCINHLKKRYVRLETNADDHIIAVRSSDSVNGNMEIDELNELIRNALKRLPEKTQLIFSMSRNLDLSHREIADQLNLTKKGVEYHMANTLKHLRHILVNHGYCLVIISIVQ